MSYFLNQLLNVLQYTNILIQRKMMIAENMDARNILRNKTIQRNNLIFAILSIIFQVIICILYGFLIRPVQFTSINDMNQVLLTVLMCMLVVVGFGLLLSYLKQLNWSGLGFTLLITAYSIEMYFLINALWNWAAIEEGNTVNHPAFTNNGRIYTMALSDRSGALFGNSIVQAFKCALANVVAFSAILGRAGPLQIFFVSVIGSFGYDLNRSVLTRYGFDGSGTMHIFIYGGFAGLVMGGLLKIKEDNSTDSKTIHHYLYTANSYSATLALIGSAFIFVLLPILGIDPIFNGGSFTSYTAPINIIFSITSSTLVSFMVSSMLNGKLNIRDIIYGPVCGGIASASASHYITNPNYAILIGITSGVVQVLGNNLIEKAWSRKYSIVNTTSFILFGVQGLIGSAFAAGYNAIIQSNSNVFNYNFTSLAVRGVDDPIFQFIIGLLSAAFGIGFGLIITLGVVLFSGHVYDNHFTDFSYWMYDDGIRFDFQGRGIEHQIRVNNLKQENVNWHPHQYL